MSNVGGASSEEPEGTAEAESDTASPVVRALLAVRGSALLATVIAGMIMLVLAATVLDGSIAGLAGIVGVNTLLYAGLGYLVLRLIGYI